MIRTARIPAPLRPSFALAGPRAILISATASLGLLFGAVALELPVWAAALLALLPWIPVYVSLVTWQYEHYGAFAIFSTLVVLQLGHLGEHVAQNLQLLATHGNMALSHGIFGQLDLETVHLLWNVAIWIGAGALLCHFGTANRWLWMAFVVAGLHSIEHVYIYWMYVADHSLYVAGGSAGILAKGGLIGSPLARPYLHLLYNVIEVTPFVIAFWDQAKEVRDRRLAHQAT